MWAVGIRRQSTGLASNEHLFLSIMDANVNCPWTSVTQDIAEPKKTYSRARTRIFWRNLYPSAAKLGN